MEKEEESEWGEGAEGKRDEERGQREETPESEWRGGC